MAGEGLEMEATPIRRDSSLAGSSTEPVEGVRPPPFLFPPLKQPGVEVGGWIRRIRATITHQYFPAHVPLEAELHTGRQLL